MDRIEPTFSSNNIKEESTESSVDKSELPPNENHKPLNLASPKRRYLGQILDLLITWGVFIVCLYTTNKLNVQQDSAGIISVVFAGIYLILSDALPKGQSLGKKLLNISVINKQTGNYCTLWQSFLRNMLTPILGVIDAIFILSKKRQRIGDMIADTIVVKTANKQIKGANSAGCSLCSILVYNFKPAFWVLSIKAVRGNYESKINKKWIYSRCVNEF